MDGGWASVWTCRSLVLFPADPDCHRCGGIGQEVIMFRWIVPKMHETQTLLATIEHDHGTMKTLAVICILALLTITGAAYSDQLFTSEQVASQRTN
jgi:hypothetical protein